MTAKKPKKRKGPPPSRDEHGLTPKQRAFVEAYTGPSAGNATDAARRAGYTGSAATLAVTGTRALKIPKIRAAIDAIVEQTRSRAVMDRRERVELLTSIARGEVDDWADMEDGPGPRRAKLKDRIRAIELLGKMDGDYLDRVQHEGDPLAKLAAALSVALAQEVDE